MPYGMLIDTTECVGCGQCEEACQKANGLPVKKNDRLSAETYTYIEDRNGVNVRHQCFHCQDPACASVCPVGALVKTAAGPVTYNVKLCMGCRYCIAACPFRIPTYEWSSLAPRVRKCILCSDRLSQGKPTACSEACPVGATIFGERDTLLTEARKRIAADPKKYYPGIFGEKEAGGTSVLYLAGVPFAKLGFPANLPDGALPHYTWDAISEIPAIVTAAIPALAGVYWITKRRQDVAAAEGHGTDHRQDHDTADKEDRA